MKIPIETLGQIKNTSATQILFNVHRYVLKNFIYLKESIQYPDEYKKIYDIWRRAFTKDGKLIGDCEDFAMQILYILWLCGFFKVNLHLSTVHAPSGEGHGVALIIADGILWQSDNMLNNPIPAYYAYRSAGYFVSKYSNKILNLDTLQWSEFLPVMLKPPLELKSIDVEYPEKELNI